VPRGSLSASIGELWLSIDRLDEVGPVGASVVPTQDSWGEPVSHSCMDP
jgi:hypothetical protein